MALRRRDSCVHPSRCPKFAHLESVIRKNLSRLFLTPPREITEIAVQIL